MHEEGAEPPRHRCTLVGYAGEKTPQRQWAKPMKSTPYPVLELLDSLQIM